MNKSDCHGCRNDFYNGNNHMGVAQCWHFDAAVKLENRIVIPIDMPPPYTGMKPRKLPPCWSASRYVTAKPEQLTADLRRWKF